MALLKRLQGFGHRESPYERPNQSWACGHQADGHPCAVGPDSRGRCRATAECLPNNKAGRWVCTRPPQHGGRCAESPGPDGRCGRPIATCQPVPTLASRRAAVVRWTLTLSLGLVLLVATGAIGREFVFSGELTYQHGEVERCGGCHSVTDHGPISWLVAAFGRDSSVKDSELCLKCHRLGGNALAAHGLPPQALETDAAVVLGAGRRTPLLLALANVTVGAPADDRPVPCGTCHREHNGRRFDLTEIGDLRCQTCHRAQFANLANGHPPFEGYPYRRRTRIAFDHASHFGKHFKAESDVEAPTSCTGCHVPEPAGRAMEVKPFEDSCAACHLGQIMGEGRAGPKGYPVLILPGFDIETLYARGREVGEWPRDADGELTSFMNLLLANDPEHADDLFELAGVDMMDLRAATDAQLDAAARTIWSIKRLVYDLMLRGHDAFRERVSLALSVEVPAYASGPLMGTMPVDAMASVQRQWFPDLTEEISLRNAGEPVPPPEWLAARLDAPTAPVAPGAPAEPGAAEPDDDLGGGLLGDDSGAGLLGDDSGAGLLGDDAGGGLLGDDSGGGLLGDDAGGGLLGDDSGGGLLSDDAGGGLLGGDEGTLLDQDEAPAEAADEDAADAPTAAASTDEPDDMAPADTEGWMQSGGWYRDGYALRYRPIGHRDPFMRAWIDLTAGVGPSPGAAHALEIFAGITSRKAPGMCGKCHSVDATAAGVTVVNWRPKQRPQDVNRFTEYAHAPHFSLLDEKGCLTCHVVDYKADFMAGFDDLDPDSFASNFKQMPKELCASCHVDSLAGDACTDCHNYHIGLFPPALSATPLVLEAGASAPDESAKN